MGGCGSGSGGSPDVEPTSLVTVIVYVFVVDPFWAVTATVMVLEPTFNDTGLYEEPEATAVPLTVTVA